MFCQVPHFPECGGANVPHHVNTRISNALYPSRRSGYFGAVPTLHSLCVTVLQEHVDSIEECGPLPYDILEPVLQRASPATLARIEDCNPHLRQDAGPLWEKFAVKQFPK